MTQQEYGYHSIYKGPVYNSNGDFVGFSQNIHEHAQQYGYWRFADDLENRHAVRAHRYGLQNPEQLFSVNQNARGSWHDEIKLTWYPGEKDPYQVSRTGSTGQHMSSIAEERTLVGLPPLLAHETPLYPISTDRALRMHRRQNRENNARSGHSREAAEPKLKESSIPDEQEIGRGSVPQALSPSRYHPITLSGETSARPLPHASTLSPFQQGHVGGEGRFVFAAPQASNPSLVAQSRARAAALVANAHTTATHAVPQSTVNNVPFQEQNASQRHAGKLQAIQRCESRRGSRSTGGPSSAPGIIPATPLSMSSSSLLALDSPQVRFSKISEPMVIQDTLQPWSYETKNSVLTHARGIPSPSSKSGGPISNAPSPASDQLLRQCPDQSGPHQSSAAQYLSPIATQSGSSSCAPHPSINPPSPPYLFRGLCSPAHATQSQSDVPQLPNQGASGEVRAEASQSHSSPRIPCPPTILPDDIPVSQDLNSLPGSSNVDDLLTEPNDDVTEGQNTKLMLDLYDSKNTGVDTEVATSDHVLEALQLFDKISKSFTETIATAPNIATNKSHSLCNQRQDVEIQLLDRGTLTGLQRVTAPREHLVPSGNPEDPPEYLPEEPEILLEEPGKPIEGPEILLHEPEIPEEPGVGARHGHNDEFNTALVPLSEVVPCMICGGTKEHRPECMIADALFGPLPTYNEDLLERLRNRVERQDPEQWRKHENPPVLPEPEPIYKVLPQLNTIIKKEASYKNDTVLHDVANQLLPIMWALRTAPKIGVHLVSPEGEIYDPDHPVWAGSK